MVPGNTLQRDRTTRPRRRSWYLQPEAGSYSALPCWNSAQEWLAALDTALSTPAGIRCREAIEVSLVKVLLVAMCDAEAADHDTGRNLATSNATVARRTGLSIPAVRRSRRVIALLGFSRAVVVGRRLRLEETQLARQAHGRAQTYAASTRALVMPRETRSDFFTEHQPVNAIVPRISYVSKSSPTRAKRRAKAAASRRPADTKKMPRHNVCEKPRDLGIQKLAAALVDGAPLVESPGSSIQRRADHRSLPRLAENRHIGQLCNVLATHNIADKGWTAREIWHHLDLFTRSLAKNVPHHSEWRNPLGYFTWLLQSAIPKGSTAPGLLAKQERAARDRQHMEAARAERERLAIIHAQKDEIDAIIAAMKTPRRRAEKNQR